VSNVSLILTDRSLALSEPKAVGAQGSTKVLAASSLGSCLVFVSGAVVTVALAAIGRDMRLSPLDLQWVMNAELLPLAALTLVGGALGDRFGQKRIFLAGIALYGLGAAVIAFAPSFALLIGGRFLQGLGEAVILPNGLSVLGRAFPADKKARAIGIWSAAAAVASGVAPAIAGAIIDHGSWRTAFLMLLPIVASALAFGTGWIPKDSSTSYVRIDVYGAVSKECAEEMVRGALAHASVDLAVSVTGIAGPTGAVPGKPIGLVFFSAGSRSGRLITKDCRYGDIGRDQVRRASLLQALAMLKELAEEEEPEPPAAGEG